MSGRQVKFWYWVVGLLPARLVYFCGMSIIIYATTGEYGDTIVPDITAMDAIGRFSKDRGLHA